MQSDHGSHLLLLGIETGPPLTVKRNLAPSKKVEDAQSLFRNSPNKYFPHINTQEGQKDTHMNQSRILNRKSITDLLKEVGETTMELQSCVNEPDDTHGTSQ